MIVVDMNHLTRVQLFEHAGRGLAERPPGGVKAPTGTMLHPAETVNAAILKAESRSRNEVLALAGRQPGTDLNSERAKGVTGRRPRSVATLTRS